MDLCNPVLICSIPLELASNQTLLSPHVFVNKTSKFSINRSLIPNATGNDRPGAITADWRDITADQSVIPSVSNNSTPVHPHLQAGP